VLFLGELIMNPVLMGLGFLLILQLYRVHADIYPIILPKSYLSKRRRKIKHFSPNLRRKSGVIAARFCGAASNIRHSKGGAIINAPEIR
jgi:hypothetical protein